MNIYTDKSSFGTAYYVEQKLGPFARVSHVLHSWVPDGLKFWWMKTDAAEIEKVQRETADQGTIIHGLIATYLSGKTPVVENEFAKKPFENFVKWAKDVELKIEGVEVPVYSKRYGLAGTLDAWGYWKKATMPLVFDWKTGDIRDSHKIQGSLYSSFLSEMDIRVGNEICIVSIPRDGSNITECVVNRYDYFDVGMKIYSLWKFDNKEKLKWAHAPQEVLDARKKTRGKNRIKFDEENYKEEFEWKYL